MINIYNQQNDIITESANKKLTSQVVWIDLESMTLDEENLVENFLKIQVPSKEEMQQIELSKKLYTENDALYITASLVELENEKFQTSSITFIIFENKLITIRYNQCKSFSNISSLILNLPVNSNAAHIILINIIRNIVERNADLLERIRHKINNLNEQILFRSKKEYTENYQEILENTGLNVNYVARIQESLLSLSRGIHFLQSVDQFDSKYEIAELKTISNDIESLREYSNSLANELIFLLDATLGMIGIEQNNNIKFFTVLSIVFFPPMLIASIYGMNFHFMPDLEFKYGYPLALLLMIFSAYITYKLFKIKKWI